MAPEAGEEEEEEMKEGQEGEEDDDADGDDTAMGSGGAAGDKERDFASGPLALFEKSLSCSVPKVASTLLGGFASLPTCCPYFLGIVSCLHAYSSTFQVTDMGGSQQRSVRLRALETLHGLHEAMEQSSSSVLKGGSLCDCVARPSRSLHSDAVGEATNSTKLLHHR